MMSSTHFQCQNKTFFSWRLSQQQTREDQEGIFAVTSLCVYDEQRPGAIQFQPPGGISWNAGKTELSSNVYVE